MREDAPAPDVVPVKRRQIEQALDAWLAVWLARDDLAPSLRKKLVAERESRKAVRKSGGLRIVVGFTGTRAGMTPKQAARVGALLEGASEAHHGDCVGADVQFHELCLDLGVPVVLHPPSDPKLRAYCKGAAREEPPKPYLVRNKDIVKASTMLIGGPKEMGEPRPARGQGTWSTIRFARARGTRVRVVRPDGSQIATIKETHG